MGAVREELVSLWYPEPGSPQEDERQSFMRFIADDPDSDTPRLAMADWWEEHGNEKRADLIRSQIADPRVEWKNECGRVSPTPSCPFCATMWPDPIETLIYFPYGCRVDWFARRGFIEVVELKMSELIRNRYSIRDWFKAKSLIRKIRFADREPSNHLGKTWTWCLSGHFSHHIRDEIPAAIFRHFDYTFCSDSDDGWIRFDLFEQSIDALSDATLKHLFS